MTDEQVGVLKSYLEQAEKKEIRYFTKVDYWAGALLSPVTIEYLDNGGNFHSINIMSDGKIRTLSY